MSSQSESKRGQKNDDSIVSIQHGETISSGYSDVSRDSLNKRYASLGPDSQPEVTGRKTCREKVIVPEQDKNTKDIEEMSIKSLSISGQSEGFESKASTLTNSSSFFTVRGAGNPSFRSGPTSYLSVGGTQTCIDEDNSLDELSSGESSDTNEHMVCWYCLTCKNLQIEATHMCNTCPEERKFVCYKCLQDHNRWINDHDVISLSVNVNGYIDPNEKSDYKTRNVNIESEDGLSVEQEVQKPETQTEDDTFLEDKGNLKYSESWLTSDHSKVKMFRTVKGSEHAMEPMKPSRAAKPLFLQNKLLTEIVTQEAKYCKPLEKTTMNLQKFGTYKIKTDVDKKRRFVTDMCQLNSGKIVVVDPSNSNMTILDNHNFVVLKSYNINGNPAAVCSIDGDTIATFLNCGKVAVIKNLDDINSQTLFDVESDCRSLAYCNSELYVCLSKSIDIYTKTGERKRTIRPTIDGNMMMNYYLKGIAVSENGSLIYAADASNGVLVFDNEGAVKRCVTNSSMQSPNGIILCQSGRMFITENNSKRILEIQIGENENVLEILAEVEIPEQPTALCYEKIHDRLVVSSWCSDNVHVFTLK